MPKQETSIQHKLLRVIMLTCGIVLLATCTAFFAYEYSTYKEIAKEELSTLGEIVATNTTASLAFDDKESAQEVLASLKAEKHLITVALFDSSGRLFAHFSNSFDPSSLAQKVNKKVYRFGDNYLEGFEPVMQGTKRLGTLYLRSDMQEIYGRFQSYSVIAIVFIILSFVFAYFFSKRLQSSIAGPILELAQTAQVVSENKDYTVRAVKRTSDEVGTLTEAFNDMLTQIQRQNEEIQALNQNLEEKVSIRTIELQEVNSQLKQQNEFVQTIIDSSIDLIAVFNRNLDYVMLNKQADQIYGQNRKEMVGKNLLDVFPKLKGTVMVENLTRAFDGEFVHHERYKSLLSTRYFENFFIPLKDEMGNVDRVLVIGHDITSITLANEKLKSVNTELEKSNRDLEQFAYVASHDLQEPLRKIIYFSDLAEKNISKQEICSRYLSKISSSGRRMSELIKAVLNYSRLSHKSLEATLIDLNEVVQLIKTDLELIIGEKRAVVVSDTLPIIKGNPLQINQLFLNLISNSLKFCTLAPEISIRCSIVDNLTLEEGAGKPKGSYLQLAFKDNGIGFKQEYENKIFSIFQRLHSSSEYFGTGIGLALCKKIVENHGGFITAESEPEKGATFFVYLPLSIAANNENTQRVSSAVNN